MVVSVEDDLVLPEPARRPVAVVGAGTLGRRIALMFATRGGEVRISDPDAEQRCAAVSYVAGALPQTLAQVVARGVP